MTGETTVGQMKGPSKTNAPSARRWWRSRPAPLTGRRTPPISLPPPSLLLPPDGKVRRRHCSSRGSPRPRQLPAVVFRLHQKGTTVTSSMELRTVSMNVCAVEKDSWRRWSVAGRHRDQVVAASGGPPTVGCAAVEADATAAGCCHGRRRRCLPGGGRCGGCPTPRPAHRRRREGRSDAWSRRDLRLNPRRGRYCAWSPRRRLLTPPTSHLPSPDPSLRRRKKEKRKTDVFSFGVRSLRTLLAFEASLAGGKGVRSSHLKPRVRM